MKEIFDKEFENEINSFKYNNVEISDDKIARDFLRLLLNDPEIRKNNFDKLLSIIKISTMINERTFVTQSDLFILFHLKNKPFDNFDCTLNNLLKETMFKTDIFCRDSNSKFKDDITDAFNNGTISQEVKDHCKKLSKWLKERINFLETSIDEVLNGEQLQNKLDKNSINSFYNDFISELLKTYKWQEFCFDMIANNK